MILPHQALSNVQIQAAIPKCHIIQYKDIMDFQTLEQLFRKSKIIVFLYNQNENYGHWCLFFRIKNGCSFFDSYGYTVDTHSGDYRPINENNHNESKNFQNYLVKLIYNYKLKHKKFQVHYNEHQFQKLSPDVLTCGHHIIHRALNVHMSVQEYYNMFKDVENKDNAVILLTQHLI